MYFYRSVSCEEKLYLVSCKDLVETRDNMRWAEGRKQKLEEELEEVNGQLFVMYKHLSSEEPRNTRLKASHVQQEAQGLYAELFSLFCVF